MYLLSSDGGVVCLGVDVDDESVGEQQGDDNVNTMSNCLGLIYGYCNFLYSCNSDDLAFKWLGLCSELLIGCVLLIHKMFAALLYPCPEMYSSVCEDS